MTPGTSRSTLLLFVLGTATVLLAPVLLQLPSATAPSKPAPVGVAPLAVRPHSSLPDFYACVRPDGSDCSLGNGRGFVPPFPVGTTVTMYILPDALSCGGQVAAEMIWGDGSTSNIIHGSGRIGPFVHTYNAAGTWDMQGWDSCDAYTDYGQIPITAGFGFGGLAVAGAGAFFGLVGFGAALASAAPLRVGRAGLGRSGPGMLRSKEGWTYKVDNTAGGKVFTRVDTPGQPYVGSQQVITKTEPIPPPPRGPA